MPHVAERVPDLIDRLGGAAHLEGDRLVIDDETTFRDATIRDLAWTAAFASDEATVAAAQWLVHEAARVLGAHSASIHELYLARARGDVNGFTVPAINIRAQTFDMARTIYETATAADVGAVILELARSEQTYTFQRPIDYSTSVLAGAIAAGCRTSRHVALRRQPAGSSRRFSSRSPAARASRSPRAANSGSIAQGDLMPEMLKLSNSLVACLLALSAWPAAISGNVIGTSVSPAPLRQLNPSRANDQPPEGRMDFVTLGRNP